MISKKIISESIRRWFGFSPVVEHPLSINATLRRSINACAPYFHEGSEYLYDIPQHEIFPQTTLRRNDIYFLERAVFGSILENAYKYRQGDNARIHISMSVHPHAAIVNIKDEGVGIPQNELNRIFEDYYRASNVRERFKGSGIGLYEARDIVESVFGGTIHVKSEINVGSTFSILLPGFMRKKKN